MTKKPMVVYEGQVPLSDLLKMSRQVCAWDGCKASIPLGEPPNGWRWLAVWTGPVAAPPWANECRTDRDAVLCPKHAAELDALLKQLPLPMGKAKGSA